MSVFSHTELKDLVLYLFYHSARVGKKETLFKQNIYIVCDEDEFMINKAIEGLKSRGLLRKNLLGGTNITLKGLEHVDNELNNESFLQTSVQQMKISHYIKHEEGDGVTGYIPDKEIDVFKLNRDENIPASDRFVYPDHNRNEYQQALQSLECAIQEFREDHHFGNEWAAEKSALLQTLEAGKDYLQNKVVDVRVAMMMTIEPLKEVVAKYDQAAVSGAVSALAQTAINLLMKLFGLG